MERGYGRYYSARVTRCQGGMFSLLYGDGDREGNVPGSRLRNCSNCPRRNYNVNARVFGNYRGQGFWYPGRITARSGSGYNIRFDDGDTMTGATTCLMTTSMRCG